MEIVQKNCEKMLFDRNWSIEKKTENNFFGITHNKQKYIVFFLTFPKLNIANVKDCIKEMTDTNINIGIIIYNENITSSAKKVLTNILDIKIELFEIGYFKFNIISHKFVVPHIKLTDPEKKFFSLKYGTDIPIILKTDPIVRYYNFEKGDILKIKRRNGFISYRIVK